MGIFAINDIDAGTEMTCTCPSLVLAILFATSLSARSESALMSPHTDDYGWQDFSALQSGTLTTPDSQLDHRQACFCGALPCTGWLGGKKEKLPPGRQVPEPSVGGGSGKYRATGKAAAGKSFGGVPGSRFGAGRKVVVVPALRKAVGKREGSESEGEEPKGPTMEASCKKCRERKVRFSLSFSILVRALMKLIRSSARGKLPLGVVVVPR